MTLAAEATLLPAAWRPLEHLFRYDRDRPSPTPCAWFMHMGTAEADNDRGARVRVELYKHTATRRYLNLDHDGNAYRYIDGSTGTYEPTNLEAALRHVTDDNLDNLRTGEEA